ncbi:hypothetical protein Nepgr_014437 [Nepenthes gracilis]|uniref:Uncharacterized protein n=1 Tax=Nepenthes gracilis TaxID=150966 RepID=A0AAD3SLU8_NEPGR|nr:hypothetical protein Nepgr_014437 [Nepenthes gracilis]
MAKTGGVLVCFVVVALDVAAGFCGIEAEMAQNKAEQLTVWIFECKEPSHEAFLLGVAAAALMAVAHVTVNLLGGCYCFSSQDDFRKASPNTQLTTACFVLSWIILAVGFGMLIIGTLANDKSRASCGFSHHHMLSIGGILCFVHALVSVAYYVSATAAEN